ncbi:MAG: alanine racemase [Paracoccaceae bacterium]|nr:alanine racemase [Marinovum sp.]MDG1424849.1 alanine racemase [Paracoccaceae bacterium]MBT4871760.1 alanine racemase [Marinovum sp.]MBT6098530.1 alanine racemase [Marinovum sp.]MBT7906815.1 alanine racemase [Marinovum sp.]
MSTATLTIDLMSIRANWRALSALSAGVTGAVVKANGYGLEAARVSRALAQEGARHFFVAVAEEGAVVRRALGPGPKIYVFSGHMETDTSLIRDHQLIPMINSVDQLLRHVEAMPDVEFGVQLDSGMNRLGLEPLEWQAVRDLVLRLKPEILMSHLACADDPQHTMNGQQLREFRDMTDGLNIPRSLAATGGILLGNSYHFELTRPGVGLYGGAPFETAQSVVTLDVPVIQVRDVDTGETVGYSNTWTAPTPRKIATVSAGYADGIMRNLGPNLSLYSERVACPVVGRISMDLIGVDITLLADTPNNLQLLNSLQSIDDLAAAADTIGYEVLTSLGSRYQRRYRET